MLSSVFSPRFSALVIVASALTLGACASSGSSSSNATAGRSENPAKAVVRMDNARRAATRTGEIYLMRGLMDIFSRGIDVMAVQMRRKGLYAVDTSYTEWRDLAADIISRDKRKEVSYPIAIIGHSLGANDATKLANYLGENGIKVAYVVTFDPTEPGYVGKNINKVVNYYLPNDNNKIYKRSGFRGKIYNVDMSSNPDITHTTIEKSAGLQAKVISNVMKITRKK